MGAVDKFKCNKCEITFAIFSYVEGYGNGKNVMQTTFFCKDCGSHSLIDTYNEKVVCKKCNSKNLDKGFKYLKCPKCGGKDLKGIESYET